MEKHSRKHKNYLLKKSKRKIRERQKKNAKIKRRRNRKIKNGQLDFKSKKILKAAKPRRSNSWNNYLPPIRKQNNLSISGNENKIGANPICVFPFVSLQNLGKKDQHYKCEGTGFFIHESGIFVTAKHVPIYKDEVLQTFIAIHEHGNYVSVRHVKQFWIKEDADIAIGILDDKDVRNKLIYDQEMPYPHLIPNYDQTQVGQIVKNFGFGGSKIAETSKRFQTGQFEHQWNEGPIREIHPEGRGSWNKSGPVIEGEYDTIGLASGGPVFNTDGEVIGVNSKSMPVFIEGDPPISIFTPITEILEIEIDHPIYGRIHIRDLD